MSIYTVEFYPFPKHCSGVTPMSSTGLEPGAYRRSGFQGGHPDLSCPGALFIQFPFRILLLN